MALSMMSAGTGKRTKDTPEGQHESFLQGLPEDGPPRMNLKHCHTDLSSPADRGGMTLGR
jgi:hypothetical protein